MQTAMCKLLHLLGFILSPLAGERRLGERRSGERKSRRLPLVCAVFVLLAFPTSNLLAESCRTASDLDDATRSALTSTALHYFDLVTKGDSASLRAAAIPNVAGNFSGIEALVKDNQSALAGSKATARSPFLLEAEGTAPIPRAEFLCGVFGTKGQTSDSAVFNFNNLAPGKYAVVTLDVSSPKTPYSVSLILEQQSSDWKLGGLYIKASQARGHNSAWFVARAKEFQTKGQTHNAWLYYLEARVLASPAPFMSTAATDKLYDDSQKLQPTDFPFDGKTTDLSAGTSAGAVNYKLTTLFPDVVGNDLDLVVKYQAADISNTTQAYQSNVAVMKALVTKYPELRDAFAGVVARAVDPSGRDYGTLLAMKDIK